MIVTCALFNGGVIVDDDLNVSDAFERGREPGHFVWIALHRPTTEEFAAVQEELNLHPLAVEDALRAHQRPKLEVFEETVFVVAKTAHYNDQNETIDSSEVHLFAGQGFVVTVHHGELDSPSHLASHARDLKGVLRFGPGSLVYAVLDHIVDGYQQVIEGVENDIDQLEAEVFSVIRTNSAERIFRLKRQVLEFQRSVVLLEEVLDRLVRQQIPESTRNPLLAEYFRDVHDHAMRIGGRIDTARETLSSALEANLAQVGVRQNEDMRAMSGWAAVIGVPTLFAGIWGMNFEQMPELRWGLGYPIGLLTVFGSGAIVRWKLRRNGWL